MKLSIIIPTCNRPSTLAKLLNTIPDSEQIQILIMENGSSAKNKRAYKSLPLNKNASLQCSSIGNLPAARNRGLKKAMGEYIIHLDDDDMLYEKFISYVLSNDLHSDIYRMNYFKKKEKRVVDVRWNGKFGWKSLYCSMQVSTFLIKRNIYFEKKLLFNENFFQGEDLFFGLNVFKTGIVQEFIDVLSMEYDAFEEPLSMTRSNRDIVPSFLIFNYMDLSNKLDSAVASKCLYNISSQYENGAFNNNSSSILIMFNKYYDLLKHNMKWTKKPIKRMMKNLKKEQY